MDQSTLSLHKQLLRLAKGALTAYEQWLADQADDAAVAQLRTLRRQADEVDKLR